LKISVQQAEKLSLEQIRAFLEASEEVHFEGEKREEIYGWAALLQVHSYRQQSRGNRGLLRRYVEKLTGLSRAQVTRLVGAYLKSGEVKERSYRRHRFAQRYTRADIELLAETVSVPHSRLSFG
jgi:phage-related minor tail protein